MAEQTTPGDDDSFYSAWVAAADAVVAGAGGLGRGAGRGRPTCGRRSTTHIAWHPFLGPTANDHLSEAFGRERCRRWPRPLPASSPRSKPCPSPSPTTTCPGTSCLPRPPHRNVAARCSSAPTARPPASAPCSSTTRWPRWPAVTTACCSTVRARARAHQARRTDASGLGDRHPTGRRLCVAAPTSTRPASALAGWSLGGHLALRGAGGEPPRRVHRRSRDPGQANRCSRVRGSGPGAGQPSHLDALPDDVSRRSWRTPGPGTAAGGWCNEAFVHGVDRGRAVATWRTTTMEGHYEGSPARRC